MRRTHLVFPVILSLLALAAQPFGASAKSPADEEAKNAPATAALIPAEAAAKEPLYKRQWGVQQTKAPTAWSKSTGEDVVIAIVDSGVDATHPELASRLLPGASWVGCGDGPKPCAAWDDGNGHGTHVAGIAAAPIDGRGIVGVAPGARILPVRVLDDDAAGYSDDVAAGIRWAVDNGADVINVSLGGVEIVSQVVDVMGIDDYISRATQYALSNDVLVVFAAGNRSMPVCSEESLVRAAGALCVGSVDRWALHAAYSNFGYGLDVVAGGGLGSVFCDHYEEDVLSTYAVDQDLCDEGLSGYITAAGTSMAAPHVSGVAALLAAVGVRGAAAGTRIRDTAVDLGVPGRDAVFGAGLVDAARAVG